MTSEQTATTGTTMDGGSWDSRAGDLPYPCCSWLHLWYICRIPSAHIQFSAFSQMTMLKLTPASVLVPYYYLFSLPWRDVHFQSEAFRPETTEPPSDTDLCLQRRRGTKTGQGKSLTLSSLSFRTWHHEVINVSFKTRRHHSPVKRATDIHASCTRRSTGVFYVSNMTGRFRARPLIPEDKSPSIKPENMASLAWFPPCEHTLQRHVSLNLNYSVWLSNESSRASRRIHHLCEGSRCNPWSDCLNPEV